MDYGLTNKQLLVLAMPVFSEQYHSSMQDLSLGCTWGRLRDTPAGFHFDQVSYLIAMVLLGAYGMSFAANADFQKGAIRAQKFFTVLRPSYWTGKKI